MNFVLIIPLLLSFFLSLLFTPIWIKKAKQIGLMWEDMNKPGHPKNVAGAGGIIISMAFIFGVLSYVFIETFYFKSTINLIETLAIMTTVLLALIIGFVDDIFGWAKGGLSVRSRLLLLILASIPLVVINAGESTMMGIDFGLFYPLLLIPLGIVGASATYNFLAGYNGLETSQGIIFLSALAFVTFITGSSWLSIISLIMVTSLIAFYIFNKYPAKIFPGDGLTYPIGVLIAIIAILGNIEKIAVFFFIPYILETILKMRGRGKRYSFAKVNEDGSLEVPYEKFYGLEHIAIYLLKKIKKDNKVYEKEVVYLINIFQIVIIAIGFLLFRGDLFL